MGRNPAPINQLQEATKDGRPDENPQNNCTFASLAWIVRDIGSETDCDGDELHDECEGQGATGPYDPTNAKFIAAAARRGVTLSVYRGTGAQLVAKLHAVLASGGGDALINIPSQWGTPPADPLHPSGSTHCVAVAYSLTGGLRCMNPWGGFWHDGDDAYWAARICYGYILIATASAATTPPPPPSTGPSTGQTDEPGALWIPTSHCWAGRPHGAPKWLIVHGTGSSLSDTPQAIGRYFQTNNPPSSTHYCVGRDGTIAQYVHEADSAWGNGPITGPAGTSGDGVHHDAWWDSCPGGNPNYTTISIEHVNDAQNGTPLTSAQQDASFRLIAAICQRHGIPARKADAAGGITGHFSMDPVNRSHCPGNYPWQALWAFLDGQQGQQQETNSVLSITDAAVAPFFALQANGSWKCLQTGQSISDGILAFYRALPAAGGLNGITALGLPTSGPLYPASAPGVAIQVFERGAVVYDPGRTFDNPPGASGDCYLGHIDSGPALGALESGLQAQLSALTAQLAQAKSDLATAQAQLTAAQTAAQTAQQAQATAEAAAQKAARDLAAAQQQVSQLTAQLAEAQKGLAVVEALKTALAA